VRERRDAWRRRAEPVMKMRAMCLLSPHELQPRTVRLVRRFGAAGIGPGEVTVRVEGSIPTRQDLS
jgi:hypothetical protein